jgi:hypothetical protein
MSRNLLGVALLALVASACRTAGTDAPGACDSPGYLDDGNYAYAIYNERDELVHSPIERLRRDLRTRTFLDPLTLEPSPPVSDVYVLVHGWNHTVEQSFALYEEDRRRIGQFVETARKYDKAYQPYFIFVVWNSVSRPLTSGLESVSPWDGLTDVLSELTVPIDELAFALPSVWGESQHAFRISVGSSVEDFKKEETGERFSSDYQRATRRCSASPSTGCEAPLGTVLEELIRIVRDERSRGDGVYPKLHVVGHSFGGKAACLAAHDGVQRWLARECVLGADPVPETPLIDSLVLLLPAMTQDEVLQPLGIEVPSARREQHLSNVTSTGDDAAGSSHPLLDPDSLTSRSWLDALGARPLQLRRDVVAGRIGTKVLVHSRYDSANGWAFGTSDLICSHAAVQEAEAPGHSLGLPAASRAYLGLMQTIPMSVLSIPLSFVEGAGSVIRGEDGADDDGWWEETCSVAEKVVWLPFSLWVDRASIGNRGLRAEVLKAPTLPNDVRGAGAFVKASEALTPRLAFAADGNEWVTYNARRIYDGASGWLGSSCAFIGPGAHGDIRHSAPLNLALRSKDYAQCPFPNASRQTRTFQFIYNVTRGLPASERTAAQPQTSEGSAPGDSADAGAR